MIKKQHFVALTASLALVLSGCETTDLVTDGISTAEEENTVIELVGPNVKSGSIKLPTSGDDEESSESGAEKDAEEDSESQDSSSTDKAESGSEENESDKSDDEGTKDQPAEEPSKNVEDTTDKESGDKTEESTEDSTEKTDEESGDKTEESTEDSTEKTDEESGDKTEESTEDSTEKTDEESGDKTEESAEDSTEKTDEESGDKTEESTEDSTEKTEEESGDKTEESAEDSTEKTDEESGDKTGKDESDASDKTETTVPEKSESGDKTEESTEDTTPENDYSKENKILLQKVEAARMAAIDAGAKSVSPILWTATEGIYNTEKSAVESGTKLDLSAELNDLIARYNGLENLAQAKDLKDEIEENNLASFRQATYEAGKEIFDDLTSPLAVIQSGNSFNKQAITAESDFRLVLRTAYNSIAQNERTAAYEAKLKADSVKAYVSRKDDYTHAVSLYRNGELRRSVDPKTANDSYKLSREEFLTLYEEISAARAQAQKEIDEAKKSVAQSANAAEQADVEAPLGNEPVDGIEAEGAKLLEDDDFSNAGEAAEIEAPDEEQ